jgi:hypothetical protein
MAIVMDRHSGPALQIAQDFNQDQTASAITEAMFDSIGGRFGNNERDGNRGVGLDA